MNPLILVVEDEESIREAMHDALDMAGYRVENACNGQEALDLLNSKETPALIFLDVMMPVMDGIEFCKRRARDSKISKIPVVLVSADGSAEQNAKKFGADQGLKKPLELENLIRVAQQYCIKSA